MQNTTVVCDNCGADLASTGNCVDYRLALTNEHIPSWGGAVTSMAIRPPLEQNAHFCDLICLRTWIEAKHPARPKDAITALRRSQLTESRLLKE